VRHSLSFGGHPPSPREGRHRLVDITERYVPVDFRLAGQAEDPFADDVALNLVGATTDGGEVGVEGQKVGGFTAPVLGPVEHGFGAQDRRLHVGALVQDPGHGELAERRDGRGGALSQLGFGPHGVPAIHQAQRIDPGDGLAKQGVVVPTRRLGQANQIDVGTGDPGRGGVGLARGLAWPASNVAHHRPLVSQRSL
jgi:hypothetical protein